MIWAQMEFDHEKHHRTGILLIFASEEVIETLEDNQVIRSSTYVCVGIFHMYVKLKCRPRKIHSTRECAIVVL